MITFFLICAGLVLLSGLFYLLPGRIRQPASVQRGESNMEWYRLRQAELAKEGNDELIPDLQLRLLDDMPAGSSVENTFELVSKENRQPIYRWLLLPLVAFASASLYYLLGAAPDVHISRQLKAMTEHTTAEQVQELMTVIETRSGQRPQNLHYRSLLGRYYMGLQDYRRAAETYAALALEVPEDDQVLAFAAQASYLAGDRALGEDAQMLAEQSLAINPQQRTALGLLGMASFEQGQFRAAIDYWQRLLAMEPPGSEAAVMIAGVVERAREKLGESGQQTEAVATEVPVSPGVTVRVSLPADTEIEPSSTVFILARAANSDSRMPIAVQRLTGSDLPAVLRLDDSTSMAGQKLSEAESIVVVVQVSPDGRPGEANATWLGDAGPLSPSLDIAPLEIVLQAVN